jgi:hypothetical protein
MFNNLLVVTEPLAHVRNQLTCQCFLYVPYFTGDRAGWWASRNSRLARAGHCTAREGTRLVILGCDAASMVPEWRIA